MLEITRPFRGWLSVRLMPMATPPTPTTVQPELAELDACLVEALKLAQNFAERMRLTRMQVLVAQLRNGTTTSTG